MVILGGLRRSCGEEGERIMEGETRRMLLIWNKAFFVNLTSVVNLERAQVLFSFTFWLLIGLKFLTKNMEPEEKNVWSKKKEKNRPNKKKKI